MHRRFIGLVAFALVTSAVAVSWSPEASATGLGIFRSRSRTARPAPTTRVYRSYSASPGSTATPDGSTIGDAGAVVEQPARPVARPTTPSKPRPSYMRADSKASGRFGQ